MGEFLEGILAFPTIVFTSLLGVVLLYWLFVIFGALDIDILDSGEGLIEGGTGIEGAAKGALEGATKGVLEGATKGVLEGASKGVLEGAAKGALEGAAKGGTELAPKGGLLELPSTFGLRQAPVTVTFSLLIAWSWLFSILAMHYGGPLVGGAISHTLLGVAVLVLGFVASVPFAAISLRPLAPLFVTHGATKKRELIGSTCTITTGRVDAKFGQASVETGGAGMLLQVRCDKPNNLKRGDEALIVDIDQRRDAFIVEPLASALEKS